MEWGRHGNLRLYHFLSHEDGFTMFFQGFAPPCWGSLCSTHIVHGNVLPHRLEYLEQESGIHITNEVDSLGDLQQNSWRDPESQRDAFHRQWNDRFLRRQYNGIIKDGRLCQRARHLSTHIFARSKTPGHDWILKTSRNSPGLRMKAKTAWGQRKSFRQ